jgi:hypothetical protein
MADTTTAAGRLMLTILGDLNNPMGILMQVFPIGERTDADGDDGRAPDCDDMEMSDLPCPCQPDHVDRRLCNAASRMTYSETPTLASISAYRGDRYQLHLADRKTESSCRKSRRQLKGGAAQVPSISGTKQN